MRSACLVSVPLLLAGCGKEYVPIDCEDAEHHCVQGEIFDVFGRVLPGAEICVFEGAEVPCATSAEDGSFHIPGLPQDGELIVSIEAEGYSSVLYPVDAAVLPRLLWETYMVSDTLAETQAKRLGFDLESMTRMLLVDLGHQTSSDPIHFDHLAGGTIETDPDEGVLMYVNNLYLPDEDLEETSGAGNVAVANPPEGEVRVWAQVPAGTCEDQLYAWPKEPGEPYRAPIVDGWVTYMPVGCPE